MNNLKLISYRNGEYLSLKSYEITVYDRKENQVELSKYEIGQEDIQLISISDDDLNKIKMMIKDSGISKQLNPGFAYVLDGLSSSFTVYEGNKKIYNDESNLSYIDLEKYPDSKIFYDALLKFYDILSKYRIPKVFFRYWIKY